MFLAQMFFSKDCKSTWRNTASAMLKQMIFGIVLHKQQGMSNRRYTVLQKPFVYFIWIIISLFQNWGPFDVNQLVAVTYFSLDLISGNWCKANDDHMDQSDGVSCCYSWKRFREPRPHSCAASSFPHPSWTTAWLKGYVSSWYNSDDLFVSSQKH